MTQSRKGVSGFIEGPEPAVPPPSHLQCAAPGCFKQRKKNSDTAHIKDGEASLVCTMHRQRLYRTGSLRAGTKPRAEVNDLALRIKRNWRRAYKSRLIDNRHKRVKHNAQEIAQRVDARLSAGTPTRQIPGWELIVHAAWISNLNWDKVILEHIAFLYLIRSEEWVPDSEEHKYKIAYALVRDTWPRGYADTRPAYIQWQSMMHFCGWLGSERNLGPLIHRTHTVLMLGDLNGWDTLGQAEIKRLLML